MTERVYTKLQLDLPKDLDEELQKYTLTNEKHTVGEEIQRSIRLGIIIDRTLELPTAVEPQTLDEIRHSLFRKSIEEAVYQAPVLEDISSIGRKINLESDFLIESNAHETNQYRNFRLRLGPTLTEELNKISSKRHTTLESLLVEFVRHYVEIRNTIPEDL